jgi:hypothetical protein
MYCETYLRDLKFGYIMFRDLYEKMEEHFPEELDKVYNENWKIVYED